MVSAGLAALLLVAPIARAAADDRADTLLKAASAATAKLQSLRANVQISMSSQTATGTVELKRPNLARAELRGGSIGAIVADGRNVYTYSPTRKQYARQAEAPDGKSLYLPYGIDLSFFHPEAISSRPPDTTITYAGRETVGGEQYDVVQRMTTKPYSLTVRYFISPRDNLIHRTVMTVKGSKPGESMTSTTQITNIQANVPLEASAFHWTPPANATLYQPSAPRPAGLRPPGGGQR
jgi:outer membrane lipoprotein-sorting protein